LFVFNKGELVEEGTLTDLIDRKNYFYHLHNAQSLH
jgi:ABC-type multidrug transport system fused ATPase/permease subunit